MHQDKIGKCFDPILADAAVNAGAADASAAAAAVNAAAVTATAVMHHGHISPA